MTPTLLAIDLGRTPAVVVGREGNDGPELCQVVRYKKPVALDALLSELRFLRRRWKFRAIVFEQTFTWPKKGQRYLLNVGRKQAEQAGALKGLASVMGVPVIEVPPVSALEAQAAWAVLRQSAVEIGAEDDGHGPKGEHCRDSCGCLLRGLSRVKDLP